MAYRQTLEHITSMDFKIEAGATTILFKNYTTGATLVTYPANTLSAVANGATGITIEYTGGEAPIIENLSITTVKVAGTLQAAVQVDILSALNALFANAGGGDAPAITSGATVRMTTGATLNYEIIGTNVVTYSWDSLPTGVVTVEGKHSTIIGGSALSVGTYTAVARVTNYHGTSTLSVSIIVSTAFTNTLSLSGTGNTWMRNLDGATYDTTAFYRLGNGSGVAEAWSNSFWLKTNFTGTASQSYGLILYGNSGNALKSIVTLLHDTTNAGADSNFYFKFGVGDCYTVGLTDIGIANNTWFHVMMTYSGGATVNTGAGFFNFYVNGVLKTTTWSFVGPGTYHSTLNMSINKSNGYDLVLLRGTKAYNYNAVYAPNTNLEEFATWKGVELNAVNALDLYNSGTPFDLNAAFTPVPYTYLRCGDGTDVATDPIMSDNGTSGIDLTMQGGSVANYVSDTP
tara:strand:+ start:262 stop:1635 length:1374 start_codon:yes stop_codon:yes gene_type:complete